MRIADYQGGVAIVSASAVSSTSAPLLIVNCKAVYVYPYAATSEDMALVKRGLVATLDDPHGLEDFERKYRVTRVNLPPRDVPGVDGDRVDAVVGERDGDVENVPAAHVVGDVSHVGGGRVVDDEGRGAPEVKDDVELGVVLHDCAFLRLCYVVGCYVSSLFDRGKAFLFSRDNEGKR